MAKKYWKRTLGKSVPKPKTAPLRSRRRVKGISPNPEKGFTGSKQTRKPMTKIEKRRLGKLQKYGKSSKRERYENYMGRIRRSSKPIGSWTSGTGGKQHGFKQSGGPALGFQVHFDKGMIKKTMKEYGVEFARLAHTITTRVAVSDGMESAKTHLSIAKHMSKYNPDKHVQGDVFDHLSASLAHQEDEVGRWLRHMAGSYDTSEDLTNRAPTGLRGWHTGKNVNLAEMYEEGVDPFPYSTQPFLLIGANGARRNRTVDYVAVLKGFSSWGVNKGVGLHPGYPKVAFIQRWMDVTKLELTQQYYNDTVAQLRDITGY